MTTLPDALARVEELRRSLEPTRARSVPMQEWVRQVELDILALADAVLATGRRPVEGPRWDGAVEVLGSGHVGASTEKLSVLLGVPDTAATGTRDEAILAPSTVQGEDKLGANSAEPDPLSEPPWSPGLTDADERLFDAMAHVLDDRSDIRRRNRCRLIAQFRRDMVKAGELSMRERAAKECGDYVVRVRDVASEAAKDARFSRRDEMNIRAEAAGACVTLIAGLEPKGGG